ncbi:MAG: hypothetical protein ACPKPY_04465 [Nitrososphaeraceae archaeon]
MNKFKLQFAVFLIASVVFFSLFGNNVYAQNKEIGVVVHIFGIDNYIDQVWDINTQLRDKSSNSEIARDNIQFTITQNQTLQFIIPLINSTSNVDDYTLLVNAASTVDDIDLSVKIDKVLENENNIVELDFSNAT